VKRGVVLLVIAVFITACTENIKSDKEEVSMSIFSI
jgi:hypothetical protein